MKNRIVQGLVFLITLIIHDAYGQLIDYNTIILPSNAKNISVEEKLVQLAWNNGPSNQIEFNNLIISAKEVKVYNADWLNLITFSANLNEFNINPEIAPENFFYPRYNIGLNVPLGFFIETPINRGIAKLKVKNQEQLINSKKIQIRSEVLISYENYKLRKEILKIQSSITYDAQSNFLIAEQQFKDGTISLEDYNSSLNNYNNQLIGKLQKEADFQIARIELESLVGISLSHLLEIE